MSWGWRGARPGQLGPSVQVFPSQGRHQENQSQQDVFWEAESRPMNAEEILHQFPPLEVPNSWVAVVLHPAVAGRGTEWPTEDRE